LQDPNEWDATYEGGSAEDRKPLRELFLKKIEQCDPRGEWIRALERGRPFREFTHRMDYYVGVWADQEEWVDERIKWAEENLGVGFPAELHPSPVFLS
jgi:hypothetical protein